MPASLAAGDSGARLARALAPLLYLQRDETFPLSRVVAVLHPTRRIVAYHLLWRDDVLGAWLPFTKPTDEELVWVGYAPDGHPTDLWTYWHGDILHTPWTSLPVAVDVQWGKHGSLPHRVLPGTLPKLKSLNSFYATSFVLLPDIWLGKISRKGPWGFFHGYRRYRDFSRELRVADHLDAVVVGERPEPALTAVFGRSYSHKRLWPAEPRLEGQGAGTAAGRE